MANISENSLDAAIALLQQFRELAQLNSQYQDDATNRQMVNAVIASVSDVMRQAGVDPLPLRKQQQEQEDARRAAPRASRRRRHSSMDGQSSDGHKRQRLSVRLRDRARSVDTSSSPSPERKLTLEKRPEELYLAEHVIDELRKGAESEALPRAFAFAAPVPPKRLKSDGKHSTLSSY
jgi:DNA-binding protein H-NS